MRFSLLFTLSALPVIAFACEGECITGVTAGFVAGVLVHLKTVVLPEFVGLHSYSLGNIAHGSQVRQLYALLDIPCPSDDSQLLASSNLYLALSKATLLLVFNKTYFPGYFHGKCQVNGVDPVGVS